MAKVAQVGHKLTRVVSSQVDTTAYSHTDSPAVSTIAGAESDLQLPFFVMMHLVELWILLLLVGVDADKPVVVSKQHVTVGLTLSSAALPVSYDTRGNQKVLQLSTLVNKLDKISC